MNADEISVALPRADWERILASLHSEESPTQLKQRLADAVNKALTKRINAAVDKFFQASEGS